MNLDKSSIERLKKRLYSRTEEDVELRRRKLRAQSHEDVSTVWEPDAPVAPTMRYNRDLILKRVLIGAVVFFVVSLGLSAFLLTKNAPISPKKVKIEVQGPAAVGGGEELTLQILVRNQNAAAIEDADLIIEFPEGTRSPDDLETELPRTRESLGVVAAGGEIQKTAHAVLFGEENSEQAIRFYVEYRVAGSSATFSSEEQVYPLVLTSAPVSVRVESVKEITSGQVLDFNITVASNSDAELKDLLLNVEYPFGFTYETSNPKPSFRNAVWELGDLKPEQKKTITLRGRMAGENEEERIFRFSTGARSARNETEVGTAYITIAEAITIKKPFIGVELAVNGSTATQPAVSRGERVRGDITWFNNLSARIYDAEITVELSGSALNKKSIDATQGFYRSSDGAIVWTGGTEDSLRELGEGDRGTVSFSFETLGLSEGALRDPSILAKVNIKGKRLSEDNVPEIIESSLTRVIKIVSDIALTSRSVYFAGPFDNTGPLPPEVNKKTTYTILWTVTNSSSAVSGVEVTAALPSYVRFLGEIDPEDAHVSYAPVGGRVIWDVGTLAPGARKDVAFQVELEASLSQVGSAPTLIGDQRVRGTDSFSNTSVEDSHLPLTTRLSTDPEFKTGDDLVVE